jgi:hypothetical protein
MDWHCHDARPRIANAIGNGMPIRIAILHCMQCTARITATMVMSDDHTGMHEKSGIFLEMHAQDRGVL